MSEPKGVEIFHKATAVILDLLYQSFPKPISLDVWKLENDEQERQLKSTADGVNDKKVQAEIELYSHSLAFLIEQGFVKSPSEQDKVSYLRTFENCRLTNKGIAALGKNVRVGDKRSIGSALHDAIKNGKYGIIQQIIRSALFEI